ncbi:hypothetical protein BH23VER1_BH23VER1_28030 [soil metagenome]
MKTRFILDDGGWQYHHVVSRVVDRRIIFGEAEKRYFREWLGRYAEFCGIRVLTYCLMGNHFHILVGFSKGEAERFRQAATDAEVLARAGAIYKPEFVEALGRRIAEHRAEGDSAGADEIRNSLLSRMGDLSVFVQELKLRFSRWYNGRNDRVGTLWEGRFRSVLVEGSRMALETVAAYIDLNPVRAKLAADPKDYRFCGYGEAVGGGYGQSVSARLGLAVVVDLEGEAADGTKDWWSRVQSRYRLLLFGRGARVGVVDLAAQQEVVRRGGELSKVEALRCRVRYLTEGGAIGTKAFLEQVFATERRRGKFGEKRVTGARPMRGADWEGLAAIRDLQK